MICMTIQSKDSWGSRILTRKVVMIVALGIALPTFGYAYGSGFFAGSVS